MGKCGAALALICVERRSQSAIRLPGAVTLLAAHHRQVRADLSAARALGVFKHGVLILKSVNAGQAAVILAPARPEAMAGKPGARRIQRSIRGNGALFVRLPTVPIALQQVQA
jgi:hypothetical protein